MQAVEGKTWNGEDLIQSLVISEQKVGPKVYGFFKGGRLEEFLNGSTLASSDQKDPDT